MEPLNRLAWRELNGTRNYPFTDNSSLFFDGGLLPQSWILDARIYMAGNYQESGTCYVSKLTRSYDSITLTVSTASGVELGAAVVFFSSVDQIVPDPAATYANPGHVGSYTDEDNQWSRPIQIVSTAGNRAGCLIVDMTQTALAQALAEGEYVLDDTVAVFLPSVCEYSPYPQVVSINGKSGDVRITGSNGIQVKAFGGDTIKVSVVGDPNFERYGCFSGGDSGGNGDYLTALDMFISRIKFVHYVMSSNGSLQGPVVSTLYPGNDGSVGMVLRTKQRTAEGSDPATVRLAIPAFRLKYFGNSIHFYLAGT